MKRISKWMSLVLRHKPELINLEIDSRGWASTVDLIAGLNTQGLETDMETVVRVVEENEKQRFAFNEDKSRICANQGHSIMVTPDLDEAEPPELLFHGTAGQFLEAIRAEGLVRKERHHVHLSKDKATAMLVGGRKGKPVLLAIDAHNMYKDGFVFYLSRNGVWLTDHVPPDYITER